MKRFLSTILAFVMIISLVATMGISVSTKEGDVLYEVNFKGDDKYAPADFGVLNGDGTLTTSASDDGKSATITYVGTKAGRAFWGGAIKGFAYGEGKQYTISMKMAVAYTDTDGKLASGNAGVFINMPKNTEADYLLNIGYKSLVGYYGCPNIRHIMSCGAGSKAIGNLYYGDSYVTDAKYLSTVDSEGFVDLAFVVDGANVKVFINNVYLDEYDAFNTGLVETAGDLGLSVYLYNTNASITLKDAVVYDGNTVKNPTYPDYYVEGPSVTNYDTAKNGDLLFTADFSRNDTGFSARALSANADKYTITTDGGYIKFENTSANANLYYGSVVSGLEINTETRYTTEWKVKTGSQNSGFCFAVPTIYPFSNSYNIYGQFAAGKQFATQHGANKITNDIVSEVGSTGFVVVSDIANDADGYASFRVEMHGYTATVYYLNTEGQWIKYNQFDMTNTTKFGGSATYSHDTGFQLCVGFYLNNMGVVVEYKDVNIYKGLLISDSEDQKTLENLYDASKAVCGTPNTLNRDGDPNYNANYFCSEPIYVKEGDVITVGPVYKNQGYYFSAYNADGSVHTKQIKYANCTEIEVLSGNAVIVKWTVLAGVDSIRMATSQMFVDNTLITKNQEFGKDDYIAYMQSKNIYVGYFTAENADTLTNLFPTSDTTFVGRAAASGDIAADQYRTSDYIPVVEGDILYFGAAVTSQSYHLVLYDANKKATTNMNYQYMVNIGAIDDDYAIYCYRMRPGTAYVRIVVSADIYESGLQFATINQPFAVDTYKKMFDDTPGNPSSPLNGLLGDVNCDGEINAKDITVFARHLARIEPITDARCLANADIDGDGEITAYDVTKLARHIAGIELIVQ